LSKNVRATYRVFTLEKISTDLTQKSELVINQKDFPTSSLIY